MRITGTIALVLVLSLFQFSLAASSKGTPGYIFGADKTSTNNLLKEPLNAVVYDHQDVNNLLLHNLGLLESNSKVPESAKDLISQHGSKNLIGQQKVNFAFLIESKSSQSFFDNEKKVSKTSPIKHQPVLFGLSDQTGDAQFNMLNQLYSKQDGKSIVNRLNKAAEQNVEAYLYSSDAKTSEDFSSSVLLSVSDKKGAVYIVDHDQKNKFKIATNLNSCVNNILKGEYTVDLEQGTITPYSKLNQDAEGPVFVAKEEIKDDFFQFMSDICSVVGVSTLIRRDPNPSLLTFHISTLGTLEKSVSEEENTVLRQLFSIAYEKFVNNLLSQYKLEEVSGQVFFLAPKDIVRAQAHQNEVFIQLGESHYKPWKRVLAEETGSLAQTMDPTTNIIFKSVLIGFILVTAWVCIEMFRIDIQQDSVVYAKFLAADYFRR